MASSCKSSPPPTRQPLPFTLKRVLDVWEVTLLDGPHRDLWDGSRIASGQRGLTKEEFEHLTLHGEALRHCFNQTGKVLFKSWFPPKVCHHLIRYSYDVESKAPRKAGREYNVSNLFNDPSLTTSSPNFISKATGPLTASDVKRMKNLFFPGWDFGAEQMCPIFNMPPQWELRMRSYPLAVALLQSTALFPDIDRVSKKTDIKHRGLTTVPAAFPHVDSDPDRFLAEDDQHATTDDEDMKTSDDNEETPQHVPKRRKTNVKKDKTKRGRLRKAGNNGATKKEEKAKEESTLSSEAIRSLAGILFLCDLPASAPGFAYVPGSHTAAFWRKLKAHPKYRHLFLGRTSPPWRHITRIDRKNDPLHLCRLDYEGGRLVKLGALSAGSWFIFKENALHAMVGSQPGQPGRVRFAQYLGWAPQNDPDKGGFATAAQWRQDRIRSLNTGWSPTRQPSGARSHAFQPVRFDRFPRMAQAEHDKNGTPLSSRPRKSDGKLIPQLKALDPKEVFGYRRPALTKTPLGRYLVGDSTALEEYVAPVACSASKGTSTSSSASSSSASSPSSSSSLCSVVLPAAKAP